MPFKNAQSFVKYLLYFIGNHHYLTTPQIGLNTSSLRDATSGNSSESGSTLTSPRIGGGGGSGGGGATQHHGNATGTYSLVIKVGESITAAQYLQIYLPMFIDKKLYRLIKNYSVKSESQSATVTTSESEKEDDLNKTDNNDSSDDNDNDNDHSDDEIQDEEENAENKNKNENDNENAGNENENINANNNANDAENKPENANANENANDKGDENENSGNNNNNNPDWLSKLNESSDGGSEDGGKDGGNENSETIENENEEETQEYNNWLNKIKNALIDENNATVFTGKIHYCFELSSILCDRGAIVYIEKTRNIADRNQTLIPVNTPFLMSQKQNHSNNNSNNNDNSNLINVDNNDDFMANLDNNKDNENVPLSFQMVTNHYFAAGLLKKFWEFGAWRNVMVKCIENIIENCLNILPSNISNHMITADITKQQITEIEYNSDFVNEIMNEFKIQRDIKLVLGSFIVLNENSLSYANLAKDNRHLFRGCRV